MADPIKEAQKLYTEAIDALSEQRRQIEEDLKFSDPSDPQQWEPDVKAAREKDPGGSRPCLVFDQLGQYVANVAGQIEQRPPSLHSLPVDGGADKKVAEKLDGFFRQIEYASRATQHYARALTSAARVGVGYLVVRPEVVSRALNWQEPRIGSEGDPLRVVFDPWSVELDGSDAKFGFLLTPFSHRQFEREFGAKAEKVNFGDEHQVSVVDERESINVCEVWHIETERQNIIVHTSADGDETELPEDLYHEASQRAGAALPVIRTYTDKRDIVKWARMSGAEILSKDKDGKAGATIYPASNIGIVPVYGYVGWSSGRMKYCGIPRRAMNAQRSFNYHMSEMHAYMAAAPKAPWITAVRAIRGLEALWDRASVDQRAYLPWNDVDEAGNTIAKPERPQISTNLANHQQGAEQAVRDIQAAIGMYQANLGAPSNEQSGVAIDARKEQGEASTAHFPAHLAAGIGQVGRLCMEMIPRLIDGKRQLRILGFDGSPSMVSVDPQSPQPMMETDRGLVINPSIGRYDMRVVVGASFSTQRQQAQQAFTEMMRSNPEMTPALAPLWAQTLDVPNADKLAQVLAAVAPPEVRAILNPESDDKPSEADLLAQNEQLKAGLQEAIQHAEEAQREADEAQAECQSLKADKEIAGGELELKGQEVQIKAYDAETKRIQAEAVAAKSQNDAKMARHSAEVQAIQAAHDMDSDGHEGGDGGDGGEGKSEQPEESALVPMLDAQSEQLAQVGEQLAQVGQLLLNLTKIASSERERIPVRNEKTGKLERVIERLVQQAPESIQ